MVTFASVNTEYIRATTPSPVLKPNNSQPPLESLTLVPQKDAAAKSGKETVAKIYGCRCKGIFSQITEMPNPVFSDVETFYKERNNWQKSRFSLLSNTDHAHHIKKSRHVINQGMKGLSGRAIILGPGLMEPIGDIAKQFKEVVLVDCDLDSIEGLAKGLSNVKCVKLDLTGGLLNKIHTIIVESKVISNAFITKSKLEEACRDFICDSSFLKELGEADYVVSSQVCSVLVSESMTFIKSAVKTSVFQESAITMNINDALSKKVQQQFLSILASLTKPSGKIVFIETVTEKPLLPLVGTVEFTEVLEKDTLPTVQKNFNVESQDQWHWLNIPCTGAGFSVQSFVLKKK